MEIYQKAFLMDARNVDLDFKKTALQICQRRVLSCGPITSQYSYKLLYMLSILSAGLLSSTGELYFRPFYPPTLQAACQSI